MAGDGPVAQGHAAADAPPPAAAVQPADAIGATVQGPDVANPDAPTASAGSPTSPPPTGPVGTPQTTGTADTNSSDDTGESTSSSPVLPTNGTSSHAVNTTPTSPHVVPKSGLDELKNLPSVQGKTKSEIEAELILRGFTSTPAKSGGTVWTKQGNDGVTAAVRIDPAKVRPKPKGFADEVPHVHKETVPTSKIDSSGNYHPHDATTHDDAGKPTTDKRDTHIPGGH